MGFGVPVSRFRVSVSGYKVSGFGLRGDGFGLRGEGFGWRGHRKEELVGLDGTAPVSTAVEPIRHTHDSQGQMLALA